MKVFKLITGIIAITLTTFSAFAQPANDDCSGATNMGSLPTPGACISGLQNGAVTTLNAQTTVGATSPALYTYQTACVGGGNMTTFALDTWYSFVATGTTVNISVSGFPNANIGIYSGTCGNLLGRGCTIANGAGKKPTNGATVYINYAGFLENGMLFDSSVKSVEESYCKFNEQKQLQNGYKPFPFVVGSKSGLIPGFIEGLEKMKIGDKAVLFIPSNLAYGEQGAGTIIPPNTNIIFEIEMLEKQ